MSKQSRSQQHASALHALTLSLDAAWAQSAASTPTVAASSPQPSSASSAATADVTTRSWSWAIAALAHPVDGNKRCNVNIVDSIVLPSEFDATRVIAPSSSSSRKATAPVNKNVLWLTTHKSGAVVRKRIKHASGDTAFPAADISERFVRLASRWAALSSSSAAPSASSTIPSSPLPTYIAVLVLHTGERQLLEPAAFQKWLDTLEATANGSLHATQQQQSADAVAGLQAFVLPARGSTPSFVTATYVAVSSNRNSVAVVYRDTYCAAPGTATATATEAAGASLPSDALLLPQTSRLRKEVERMTRVVVDALQRASSSSSNSCCCVQRALLEFVVDCDHNVWLTHMQPIEMSHSSPFETPPARGLRPQQSLPTLLPSSSSSLSSSSVASPTGSNVAGASTATCQGDFCHVAPSQLPGLFPLISSSDNNNNNNNSVQTNVLLDTGERIQIGHNSVQVARAEMRFLLGTNAPSNTNETPRERAMRWHEANTVLQPEVGRRNHPTQCHTQVPVCLNCNRIYLELQRVRDSGFRDTSDNATAPRGGILPVSRSVRTRQTVATTPTPAAIGSKKDDDNSVDGSFDRLFLHELTKHDDVQTNRRSARSRRQDAIRPEVEVEIEVEETTMMRVRPLSSNSNSNNSSRSEQRAALPSLSLLPSRTKTKKKPLQNSLPNNHADDKHVVAALHDRLRRLEDELAQMRSKLTAAERHQQQLEQRCVQTQFQCTALLAEKDAAMRTLRLECEQTVTAAKQQQQQQRTSNNDRENSAASSTADAMRKQLETIDALSTQLDALEATRACERQTLVQTQQLEIKTLHATYQRDAEALRLQVHAATEQMEATQVEFVNAQHHAHVATTQAQNATAALDDMTTTTLVALEEKNRRLERQVQTLLHASSTPSTAAAATTAATAAPLESTTLNNKVEYLKAQLASEMKSKEELGHHLAQITLALDAAKTAKRLALAEQDEALQRQLQRAESSFAADKEVFATQLAAAQSTIATLQANVADLVHDVTLSQRKEANATLALDKMADESVRQARRVADLEAQIELLHDERALGTGGSISGGAMSAKSASDETQRMQMEALFRRVENERQYLKNQLVAEQERSERCGQQTTVLQLEVDGLRAQLDAALQAADAAVSETQRVERRGRDAIACLEESQLLLTKQLRDAQTKAAAAREQALLDRDAREKLRIAADDARAQLVAATDALANERLSTQNTSERSAHALALARDSVRAVERDAAVRIQRLEDESALLVRQLAETQAELLVMEDTRSVDAAARVRQQALATLARNVIVRWTRQTTLQQSAAFYRLAVHAQRETLQTAFEATHHAALDARNEQLRTEWSAKCNAMAQRLVDERTASEQALNEQHRVACDALRQTLQREQRQQEEQAHQAHVTAMQTLQQTHDAIVCDLTQQLENVMDTEQTLRRDADAIHAADAALLTEKQQECAQLQQALDALAAATREQQVTITAQLEADRIALEQLHAQQLVAAAAERAACVAALEQTHAGAIAALTAAHDAALVTRSEAMETQALAHEAAALEVLTTAHTEALAAAHAQHQTALHETIDRLEHASRAALVAAQAHHQQQLEEAVAESERTAAAALDALQRDLGERKGDAVVQVTAKWQRALEALELRLETETTDAYARGVQDREREWQRAAAQIKQTQHAELTRIEQEAMRAVQAAEERLVLQLDAQQTKLQAAYDARFADAVAQMEHDAERRVGNLQQALETAHVAHKDAEQALRATHTDALAALALAHQQTLDAATEAHDSALYELRRALEAQAADALAAAAATHERALFEATTASDMQQQQADAARTTLQEALTAAHDNELQQLRDALERETHAQLAALETQLLRAQDDAVAQAQDDAERLIAQVEDALAQVQIDKQALENELVTVRQALEAADDAHFDAMEELKAQQQRAALHIVWLVAQASRKLQTDRASFEHVASQLQQQLDAAAAASATERTQAQVEHAAVQTHWRSIATALSNMRATLTTFKRDELVAHRSASSVLATELSIVRQQLAEVSEHRASLEREIEALQVDAQRVEASLRELLASTSSASSSSLNVAAAAKKRRLNDEFEALLEAAERKRQDVRSADATLATLHARRDAKELEMKSVERALVEILVQQQKRLLMLLSAARELPLPASLVETDASAGESGGTAAVGIGTK